MLRTLEAKQGLFAGVFEGDADEIPFEAVRTSSFLDSMRDLVSEARGPETDGRPLSRDGSQEKGDKRRVDRPAIPSIAIANPMWQGVAQLLEAACATLADPATTAHISPELREKLESAARKLADQLSGQLGAL